VRAKLVEEELVDANMVGCHGLPAFAALDYIDFRTFFLLPPAHLMPLGLVKSFWEMVLTRVRCQLGA